jgi:ABC-type phosphate transport system substrate-binding protein
MQIKKLASLCAVACAAMAASSAHAALSAAAIADLDAANTAGRVIFISGASAVQKGFTDIIAATFTGTPIYYSVQGGGKSVKVTDADFVAVSGTLASGTGTWAGQKAIIIYRVKGGSVWGVNPVARNTAIESMLATSGACGATGAGTAASPYSCGTTSLVPDAGVSDVAPKLFQAPVNTEGEVAAEALNEAELADLTATAIYGLSFGVPVTNTVSSSLNLNKATVAAIMTGNVGTWDQVGDAAGGDIVICRRVPGSGTQAVYNMWAGNFPCGSANVPADRDASAAWDPVARTYTLDIAAPTGGLVVVENSTSSNVRDCLNAAVAGGSYSTSDRDGNPVTVTFTGAGHKAIGTLSMDSLKDSKTSGNWQFRSLNGAGKIVQDTAGVAPTTTGTGTFPTFATYENGDWDLQGWISFNVPSRTTGAKAAVLAKFVENAQNPAKLQLISDLKFVAAGIPGGLYSGQYVLDAAYLNGDQCAPYNRNYND